MEVKHEGKGKMKKSVLVNIKEVAEKVGRPAEYLITYLGQKLNATSKVEKDICLSYVTGHHDVRGVQEHVMNFINDAILCHKCQNPETTCHTEGSKKNKVFFLMCKGCGKRSNLDPTDRFVKYMMQHHAEGATYGHAACPSNATDENAAKSGAREKRECPQCQHRTSKAVCGKCGCNMDGDATDREDSLRMTRLAGSSLLDVVRLWLVPLEECNNAATLDDLYMYIQKSGCTESTPVDRLGAVIQVFASEFSKLPAIIANKLQPVQVAENVDVFLTPFSALLEALCAAVTNRCGDEGAVADTVINKVQVGVTGAFLDIQRASETSSDCIVLGLLLAFKEVDGVASGLLEGCQRLENRSTAMDRFIDFLIAAESDEDDENEEDDDRE
jgi:translation initiation factor 2 beta subunit (eIF-2beta)/eIF-5